ncbi:Uncharacterised protein [Mycobacteroides abscessus subsp. abscessus]|uniref:hypothetical protein n=1 Tax=Mycobacteroides abscessus TaxID=36809 RepID=UPI00092C62B4|nr:hypothetical protein [Mycobacteroides abscessus]SHT57007.1 Uncharacterised protein [Mycobacteroides abscessus subsp. abscessus]
MRMRPVRGYRRRRQRGAAALVLVAAVAVVAALGCLTGAPRSWSTAGPGGTAHVARGPVSEMALPFLRAAADPVGADLHAPCPHAQLSATTRAGGNMPLMGAVPMVLGALAARCLAIVAARHRLSGVLRQLLPPACGTPT